METQDIFIHIANPIPRDQKNLIYHKKEYPIDFELLKKNCGYFYNNQKQFEEITDIYLLNGDEEAISLTDESVESFIKICQNEKCQIKLSNIIPLQYLSYKYDFQALKAVTDELITKYSKELLFEKLLFNNKKDSQKNSFFLIQKVKKNIFQNI